MAILIPVPEQAASIFLNTSEDLDRFCATTCKVDVEATELVRKMVTVGLSCIQNSPSNQPSMSRFVEMLEKSTKELLLPPQAY